MKRLAQMCLRGMRANLIPGIALQIFAVMVVGSYYLVPASVEFFEAVGALKLKYGYAYSAVATGVFGGLIPFLYLAGVGRVRRKDLLPVGLFFALFWSALGVQVDFLYRVQADLFGTGVDAETVLKKVLFDQFVFCPLWSAPVTALCYRWMDRGFSLRRFRASIDRQFFTLEIPSVLVSIWIVWIPGTAFVYSMPEALQIPLFNLVLCFYVLLVSVLEKQGQEGVALQETSPST